MALAGCTGDGSEISRVKVYADVAALAADSNLVIRGTALSSYRDTVNGLSGNITNFEIAACPAVGGAVGIDRVSAQQSDVAGCRPGSVVAVRTFPGDPVDGFDSGATYLLFLTETGLPDDPNSLFYVTGAEVGAFKQSSDGVYTRVARDIPDDVPKTLNDTDVA